VPSPFPGMNPYLEHPMLWPGVHNGLIAALQLSLAPQLRPRYYVAIEERLKADAAGVIGTPAADVVTTLVRCVQTFADGTPQTDDIIVLALRYLGPSERVPTA